MEGKKRANLNHEDMDVLEILKAELDFIEQGGHKNSFRAPRLPSSTFRGSPICLNYDDPAQNHPCAECLLMTLVPKARRQEIIPCHHIPITEEGKSVAELTRSITQDDVDIEIVNWLRRMISTIEGARGKLPRNQSPGER